MKEIVSLLRAKRSEYATALKGIDRAIEALNGKQNGNGSDHANTDQPVGKRVMSPAGRRKIAAAMKKRWAKARREGRSRLE